MRLSEIFAASLVAPLVAAHSNIPGAPKIFGLSQHDFGKLKSRNILGGHNTPHVTRPRQGPQLNARQGGVDGRCGPDHGCASCAESYCCSPSGWCGQGADYCAAPDCLFNYGPACDANKLPTGGSTRNVVRTKLGDQPYGGAGIYSCEKAGTIALTYDDGPYVYTNDLMDMLKAYNAKATFFVTGININKGAIDDASQPWPAVIQRMIAEQHQVASHTWSHQDLSAITKEQRYDQMIRNEMAFTNIIGKFPTYMRPPYSSCTDACQQDLADLGYVVSYFSLDTNDYNNLTPEKIQDSKDIVKNVLDPSNVQTDKFQTIAHDIHELTVHNLTAYMLDEIVKKGYKMVTLGECLGEPEANWYRTPTNRVATTSVFTAPPTCLPIGSVFVTPTLSGPIATPTAVTRDGSCGLASGFTCLGSALGECCSQYGYCGITDGHCGTGCQSVFGKCGILSSSSSSSGTSSAAQSSSSTAGGKSTVSSSSASRTSSTTKSSSVSSSVTSLSSSALGMTTSTRSVSTGTSTSTSTKTSAAPAATSAATKKVSTDGTCGGNKGYTCKGSLFGSCCNFNGRCGFTPLSCMAFTGCQSTFGTCV